MDGKSSDSLRFYLDAEGHRPFKRRAHRNTEESVSAVGVIESTRFGLAVAFFKLEGQPCLAVDENVCLEQRHVATESILRIGDKGCDEGAGYIALAHRIAEIVNAVALGEVKLVAARRKHRAV